MSYKKNKKLAKAKFNKKFKEWKYLKELEKDTRELLSLYDSDLSEVISDLHQYSIKGVDIEAEENIREKNQKEKEETRNKARASLSEEELLEEESDFESKSAKSENAATPGWVKKLYKKLALATHPDKISRMDISKSDKLRRQEIFKLASSFLDSKDYDSLMEFAGELGIEFEVEEEGQVEIIKSSLKKLDSNISSLKNQVAWSWGESESAKEKLECLMWVREELSLSKIPENIIKEYLESREKDEVDTWIEKYVNVEHPSPVSNNTKKKITRESRNIPPPRKPNERPIFNNRRK